MNPQLACSRAVAIITASASTNPDDLLEPRSAEKIGEYLTLVTEMLSDLGPDDRLLTVCYLGDLGNAFASALAREKDQSLEGIMRDVGLVVAQE